MRIIGIDPGLATTGIAILDVAGDKYLPLYCGCIITKKNKKIHQRLKEIYNGINKIILDYSPDYLAIEDIFFSVNVKTALNVGQARGVSILACSENNIKIFEYTPLQVKQAIVGYGRATKMQIKYMLKAILGVEDNFFPKEDDAWDAMAIAICHANNYKFENKIKELVE
ncbi:MAG: crossover junction endodeoxyribonuclease RuvC [Actinobacteria bacterium]|nr:crossover junction endodeoxyribonuclease RuvC [Actinomycetota bacterium]